ncbi:MAG: glycosyl hydrolase [Saprospirales bacterium]|nr:glycosyl hydrolase [Saprospirales bacterium]
MRFTLSLLLLLVAGSLVAQRPKKATPLPNTQPTVQYDTAYLHTLEWRELGPFRGGRSCAVVGVPGAPNLFYFGSTGGGVWRTANGGRDWENISDGFFGGSIGAIAVSASDHNVLFAGGGEQTVRGNVSFGSGVWKSEDAGKTWRHSGLTDSRQVGRIRIHPDNPDIVFVAAMGNLFAPNAERGVFRSRDGGATWEKVLFVNEEVGAVDICFDPTNPRILYATTWRVRRTPYSLESGGEGSGLWKSTDGGSTWTELSKAPGMPSGDLGIIGVTVSPVNPDRVWAIVEAKEGGVFRSDDAGKTWRRINEDRSLRQRAWYYTRIYADPKDEDIVYVMNVSYHRSKDGGKTFSSFYAPHGDHHDLWIAPEDPDRMIIADDGGAQITYDGGETWSTYHNQPTAQFYRVTTDQHFPYRIYGAQQDNSAIRLSHRTSGGSIGEEDWEDTAGCESGWLAVDPTDDDIVYGGCYDGLIERKDHRNDQSRNVNVWPDNPMGHGAEAMKYRFQWNFPILFSPHDPNKLYTASNHLHVTYNGGQSWETISPDLTRNDSTKLGASGGPITKDNTSVEYYCTIFTVAESPLKAGLIWTGSDDGLVYLTRDNGLNWENVTPAGLPEWAQINSVEADPFNEGGLYVAATRYKSGDFKPYLFRTKDYGKTWTQINAGIGADQFTRVVRADPKRKGLLYSGTESGIFVSFDDGTSWESFQLNLPIVPITDLAVKNDNLIAATQGRSLWMIDDLTVLHQLADRHKTKNTFLFKPMDSYRMRGYQSGRAQQAGKNHPGGVMVHFYLPEWGEKDTLSLSFFEAEGSVVRTYSTAAKDKEDQLKVHQGANRFVWNMRYPGGKDFDGMILWWGSLDGPQAIPGAYAVKLETGSFQDSTGFQILPDPRSPSSEADFQAQFDFAQDVLHKVTEAHEAIVEIRDIRGQLTHFTGRLKERETMQPLIDQAKRIDSLLTTIEEALYQTKNRSGQDPLNFPIRLTNKLAHLNSLMQGEYPPTQQAIAVKEELRQAIDAQLAQFKTVKEVEVATFNRMMRDMEVESVILKE